MGVDQFGFVDRKLQGIARVKYVSVRAEITLGGAVK